MEQWKEKLQRLGGPERACMAFLAGALPPSDRDCYPYELFLEFARHASALRAGTPWCAELGFERFCHYVLFPRVNDEDIRSHRPLFHQALMPRLAGLPAEEAALEVNRWCHETAAYQPQDERTASALAVYKSGVGRCGEESVFLVSALRSVGLAARQVYAPAWSHCDDNHAWAEVFCGGRWHFMGACEPEPVLDRGWFNLPASQAMVVHSRTFGAPDPGEALIGRQGDVYWYNQTARYAQTKRYTFFAQSGGRPVPGAAIRLWVPNTGSLWPVAALAAGADGRAYIEMGVGDVVASACHAGGYAEAVCHGAAEDGAVLPLSPGPPPEGEGDIDFSPPAPAADGPAELTDAQWAAREEALRRGNMLRQRRFGGFYSAARAAKHPGMEDVLQKARGNFDELCDFLDKDADPLRPLLLRTLGDKDLRDSTAAVLEDHLAGAAPHRGDFPPEIFSRWLLSPRIAFENITPWRAVLRQYAAGAGMDASDSRACWRRLCDAVKQEDGTGYKSLYWSPAAALRAGRCDGHSRRVLFVALMRALGVPARLDPLDRRTPQYWAAGGFVPVEPAPTGAVRFELETGQPLAYGQNWTLAAWQDGDWLPLYLPAEAAGGEAQAVLPQGRYRLVTSARLPNGAQRTAARVFTLGAGRVQTVPVRLRLCDISETLIDKELPAVWLPAGGPGAPAQRLDIQNSVVAWIDPGTEPTEHLLNELDACAARLRRMGVAVHLLTCGTGAPPGKGLPAAAAQNPRVVLHTGMPKAQAAQMAARLGVRGDVLPLCVVCGAAGRAAYVSIGYKVGNVDAMLNILDYLRDM